MWSTRSEPQLGGCDDRDLHHHDHPLRERAPAHRARARARPGRRAGPLPPRARRRGPVPGGHRRQRAEERARGRRRRARGAGVRRPQRRGVRCARRRAVAERGRLHPHQPRSPAPARRRGVLAGLLRRPVPAAVHGPVLHRLRAVLHSGRTPPRPLPRARDRAGAGQRGELVLPAVPVRRAAAGGGHHRAAADRARRAPQRGARAHRRRAGGLLGVAARDEGRRVGHPRARRPGAGRLRVVRRPVQLRDGPGLRPGRPGPWRGLPALVGQTGEPRPPARQGRAAVPRRLLAGHAAGVRAAAADRHLRARLPDRGRPEDQQVRRRRRCARAGRAGRGVRRRRGALVAAARGAAGGRRRLHRGAARRPGRRRARQRPGQPGQPGGRHDRPLPGRPAARRARPSRGTRR